MRRLAAKTPGITTRVIAGNFRVRRTALSYTLSNLLNWRLNQALKLLPSAPCSPAACSAGIAFKKREQNSGITVIATTNEAINARQNASANEENKNLLTPKSRVTGKKSTTS